MAARKTDHGPAPAVEAVEYLDVRFNGTLHKPSVSKGEPSPELDAAWNSIIFNSSVNSPRA